MDSNVITEGVNSISNSYIRSAKRDQRSSADLNVPPGEKLYRLLRGELERAGCFRAAPWFTLANAFLVVTMYSVGFTVLLLTSSTGVRILALLLLAFANVQAGLIAHEAGHGAITRNRRLASAYGHFLFTFLTGLCYSHFQNIHRRHHPHCGEEAVDPDMQSGAFSL